MAEPTYLCKMCGDHYTEGDMLVIEERVTDFCSDCWNMVSQSEKKRERERGSGNIAMTQDGSREYLRMEGQQEQAVLMGEHEPVLEYHLDDEQPFTENDLVLLTFQRVYKRLTRKGYTRVPYYEAEDIAGEVVVEFLAAMKRGTFIESIHGWHWTLVNKAVDRWMMEKIDQRKAVIPEDVLDYAQAHGIRTPSNVGAAMSINDHLVRSPDWTAVDVQGMRLYLAGCGLTDAEVAALINALRGENLGMGGATRTRRKLKSAQKKLKDKQTSTYTELVRFMKEGMR